MQVSQPIKRQLTVALYSSPAISALTVSPIFILSRLPLPLYPWAIGLSTLLVLLMWIMNAGIYYGFARHGSGGGGIGGGGHGSGNIGVAGSRNRAGRYLLSYLCSILLTFLIFHSYSLHLADQQFSSAGGGMHFHVVIFLAVDTVILILQDLVVSRERNAAMELENSQLRLRNAEALNQQLMQQVQPHFLFNSLSTLKSLIGVSPERATEYLIRLSGFLRASISSHGVSTVKVGRELDLCIDYLEMQQIRFGEALRSEIDVPAGVRENFCVPVFSLQLLIENAIKHNVLTRERPLFIHLQCRDGKIIVSNNLQKKPAAGEGGGSGLMNLQERYRALTGDPIVIEETATEFSVSIILFAYESSDHRR